MASSAHEQHAVARRPSRELLLEILWEQQYSRYAMYASHVDFLLNSFHRRSTIDARVIEFGGSNGYIAGVFNHPAYEVAPNAPQVDIHDLSRYGTGTYDFVILDEILEHVRKPWLALDEVYKILKVGGCLITSSPFMIAEHKCPDDYWRFTKDGLRVLLERFRDVRVHSWGNPRAVSYLMKGMMVTSAQALADGEFDLTNSDRFAVSVWAYAWK
jgi:hypothetical protein